MSGADRTRAKRNAKQREQTTVKDLADLGGVIAEKFNQNHDSATGEFSSGGGSSHIPTVPVSSYNSMGEKTPAIGHVFNQGVPATFDRRDSSGTVFSRNHTGVVVRGDNGKYYAHEHGNVFEVANVKPSKVHKLPSGSFGKELPIPNYRIALVDKGISDAPNLRGDDAQRCGNCNYFTALPMANDNGMMGAPRFTGICDLYDFQADDEWLCDDWEVIAPPPMMTTPADSSMADAPVMTMERRLFTTQELRARGAEIEAQTGKSAEQILRETVAAQDAAFADKQLPIVLYKQTDGRLRVVGWASNNRRDKDNPPELITEAAHKEFMGYLDANPDKAPEFWHWHTPGTAYAKADCWDYVDGFTVYSGMVYEGKEAQAERAAVDGVGMSHGFRVLGYDEKERLITKYRTFEVSDLPITRAANPYTSYNVIRKEMEMPFSDAKRAYLAEKMGEDAVALLEARTGEMKAAADALGVESKETTQEKADAADVPADKPKKKPDAAESDAEDAAETDANETAEGDMADEPADKPMMDGKKKPPMAKALSEKEIRAIIRDELATSAASIGTSVGGQVAIALKALNERIDAMETNTTAAKNAAENAATAAAKSLDEAVAEMIAPRRKMGIYQPSQAANTKVANKDGAKPVPAVKNVEEPQMPDAPENSWEARLAMTLNKQMGLA